MTPIEHCPDLAKSIGLSDLYLKREDLHPYGSHKGRSIPVMIDRYYNAGDRNFVISSSGNAALAAALYVREINQKNDLPDESSGQANLNIFVGKNINSHKLDKLRAVAGSPSTADEATRVLDGHAQTSNKRINVVIKDRPLFTLNQAVEDGARSLRQSTDDAALEGYATLAEELAAVKVAQAHLMGH